MSGSSGSSARRCCLRSDFFLAAHAVYGSVHHTGPPLIPSPETQLTRYGADGAGAYNPVRRQQPDRRALPEAP